MMCVPRLALAVALAACTAGSADAPARAPEVPSGVRASGSGAEPAPQFVVLLPPTHQPERRIELGDGRIGVVLGGRRLVVDGSGAVVQALSDGFSIRSVLPLADGRGFLFLTSVGLAHAATFAGDAKIVVPGSVEDASAGAGFVLARMRGGGHVAVDLATGAPKKGLPLGLAAVESAGGTTVGLAHGGRTYLSADGVAWTDVTARVPFAPTSLHVEGGAVIVANDMEAKAGRVTKDGFAPAPFPDRRRRARNETWPSSQGPIEAITTRGAPLGEGRAVVAEAGSVHVVALRTGEVVESEIGVLPPDRECPAFPAGDRVVFLCQTATGHAAFAKSAGAPTRLEHAFTSGGRFHAGAHESFLFSGPCRGDANKPGAACVRKSDGTWFDASRPEIGDAPTDAPLRVAAWIPKPGGALLLVAGKGGGFWDLSSGQKTLLEESDIARIEPLLSFHGAVVDRFAVTEDGAVIGFTGAGGFRIRDRGKTIERSPFSFYSAHGAGRFVLANQSDRLWQSSDYGFTFTEVDRPALLGNVHVRSCSAAGCLLGDFARIGWEPRPRPADRAVPEPASFAFASEPRAVPRRALRCTASGASKRKVAPPVDGRLGFGGEATAPREGEFVGVFSRGEAGVDTSNLRAMMTGRMPTVGEDGSLGGLAQTRRVRVVEPFDPKAGVRDATLKLSDLLDAARSAGGAPPNFSSADDQGAGIVVAGEAPSTLLVPSSGPLVWVRPKAGPLALSIGPEEFALRVRSAVQTGPEEIAVLATDGGAASVRRLRRGVAEELFTAPAPPTLGAPPTPDALAIGPDGKLAILRVQTLEPPTAEHPALLLLPGEAPKALAPWSTVAAAGSPACEGMQGYRAVIATSRPWLQHGVVAGEGNDRLGLALVRWSADKVCLEAIELPAHVYQLDRVSTESYVVVRFGEDGGAGHVFVAQGAELREGRTCTLE